jgi:hypothetical protein
MRKISFSSLAYKTLTQAAFVSLVFTTYLYAQKTPEKPNPSRIIDRAAETMGGRDKMDAIFSKQIFGTVTRKSDGATGTVEILTRRPDAYFMRLSFGNDFEQIGYNGLSAYRWSSVEELNFLDYEDVEYFRSKAAYQNGEWQNYRTNPSSKKSTVGWALLTMGISLFVKYEPGKYIGKEIIAGKPAKTVLIDLNQGGYVYLSFDDETGYLVSEKLNISNKANYEYDDFRSVNGVMMPYRMKYVIPNKQEYEIKVDRIVVNEAIENSKFEAPKSSSDRLPNLASIIEKAQKNQEKYVRNYDKFKYLEYVTHEVTSSSTDSMGMSTDSRYTVVDRFDISFYRGFLVEIKMRGSSNPLTLKSDEEKRARERKIIDEQYKAAAAKGASLASDDGLQKIKMRSGGIILDCLKNSTFTNYRRESDNKGDTFVVDFVPRDYAGSELYAGTLWIDVAEGWVTRAEIKSATKSPKNTAQIVFNLGNPFHQILYQTPICKDLWLVTSRKDSERGAEITYGNIRLFDDSNICDLNNYSNLK